MVAEKWDLKLDVAKLVGQLESQILPLAPVRQTEVVDGWSVYSSDGSYQDGWTSGHHFFDQNPMLSIEEYGAAAQAIGLKESRQYRQPTNLCTGYLEEVMKRIEGYGLQPARARIIRLKAKSRTDLHRDSPVDTYAVRLHIPIITNRSCFFKCEDGLTHLAADGSGYFVRVNRLYQFINQGEQDRYHLVMSVIDQKGVSQFHQYIG